MKKQVFSVQRTTYEVNGVKYDRLEDVPEEFRKLLADADGNGIPDILESASNPIRITRKSESRWTDVFADSSLRGGGSIAGLGALGRGTTNAHGAADAIHCAQCGYDLTGSTIGEKCPECGYSIVSSINSLIEPQPSAVPRLLNTLWLFRGLLGFLIVAVILSLYIVLRLVL